MGVIKYKHGDYLTINAFSHNETFRPGAKVKVIQIDKDDPKCTYKCESMHGHTDWVHTDTIINDRKKSKETKEKDLSFKTIEKFKL